MLADGSSPGPEDAAEAENFSVILVDWLNQLTEIQRDVLVRRFGLMSHNEQTLEQIGSEIGLTREQMHTIGQVPLQDGLEFELYTAERKGQYMIEVKDPAPVNPKRQEGGKLKPLRFGSKAAASTKGNWE